MLQWLIGTVIEVVIWVIVIEVIVSWMGDPRQPIAVTLRKITEPILGPIRRLVPPERLGGLDISPLIAILLLQFLRAIIFRIF